MDLAGEDIALTSADDIHILGGSAGSIINIGTNVDGNAINVGTDNTAADTIVIGSALDTSSLAGIAVTVGSTGTTSALTLQSGTGDVTVTSTDDFIFTATDDITISGNSAAGILNLGTGNDGYAINIGTDNTAADTIIIGSALDTTTILGTLDIPSGAGLADASCTVPGVVYIATTTANAMTADKMYFCNAAGAAWVALN